MDESGENMSTDESAVESKLGVNKVKPKKRSLVERELETSLTARVTSPIINERGTNTSRYGRARRLKSNNDYFDSDGAIIKTTRSPVYVKTPAKSPTAYKMHASNSPIKKESPRVSLLDTNLENQIENIYNANISLSRFGSAEKRRTSPSPAKKFPKVYTRKDLIQTKEKEETITLIKNMFSPVKSAQKSSHLSNVLERSSEKYNLNGNISRSQNGYLDTSSVVKTLDFDNNSKRKKKKKDWNRESENKVVISKNELFEMEAKSEYQVGDLAWARFGTYPFWPCLVTREPGSEMFVKKKLFGKTEHDIIHVTFLSDNGRRNWIIDNMLRKYQGLAEFENTRDGFSAEAKKKDPRLYQAFFISDKKLVPWHTSIEEADMLEREPKRLRYDILNDLLGRNSHKLTSISQKSCKLTRTDNDVLLSESLYDTLFSEDDKINEDFDRARSKSRNRSLDVSEVVTACLDNMAAKTGLTKIQKQSHMDRWLQKAKSKTPEKSQLNISVTIENDIKKDDEKSKEIKDTEKISNSKKKKKPPTRETSVTIPYCLRKSTTESQNLRYHHNEHDYSKIDKVETIATQTDNTDFDDDIIQSDNVICVIGKVESLRNKEAEHEIHESDGTETVQDVTTMEGNDTIANDENMNEPTEDCTNEDDIESPMIDSPVGKTGEDEFPVLETRDQVDDDDYSIDGDDIESPMIDSPIGFDHPLLDNEQNESDKSKLGSDLAKNEQASEQIEIIKCDENMQKELSKIDNDMSTIDDSLFDVIEDLKNACEQVPVSETTENEELASQLTTEPVVKIQMLDIDNFKNNKSGRVLRQRKAKDTSKLCLKSSNTEMDSNNDEAVKITDYQEAQNISLQTYGPFIPNGHAEENTNTNRKIYEVPITNNLNDTVPFIAIAGNSETLRGDEFPETENNEQFDPETASIYSVDSYISNSNLLLPKITHVASIAENSSDLTNKNLSRAKQNLRLDSDNESMSSSDDITLSELRMRTKIGKEETTGSKDSNISDNSRKLRLVLTDCILGPKDTSIAAKDISTKSAEELDAEEKISLEAEISSMKRKLRIRKSSWPIEANAIKDVVVNDFQKRKTASPVRLVKEVEFDTISISSTDSAVSNRSKSKKQDLPNMKDPDFIKYCDLNQDSVSDEHPELTQNEIVAYLYKTWLYEQSKKSEHKKNDETSPTNLVKGVTVNKKVPKKSKLKTRLSAIPVVKYNSADSVEEIEISQKTSPDTNKRKARSRKLISLAKINGYFKLNEVGRKSNSSDVLVVNDASSSTPKRVSSAESSPDVEKSSNKLKLRLHKSGSVKANGDVEIHDIYERKSEIPDLLIVTEISDHTAKQKIDAPLNPETGKPLKKRKERSSKSISNAKSDPEINYVDKNETNSTGIKILTNKRQNTEKLIPQASTSFDIVKPIKKPIERLRKSCSKSKINADVVNYDHEGKTDSTDLTIVTEVENGVVQPITQTETTSDLNKSPKKRKERMYKSDSIGKSNANSVNGDHIKKTHSIDLAIVRDTCNDSPKPEAHTKIYPIFDIRSKNRKDRLRYSNSEEIVKCKIHSPYNDEDMCVTTCVVHDSRERLGSTACVVEDVDRSNEKELNQDHLKTSSENDKSPLKLTLRLRKSGSPSETKVNGDVEENDCYEITASSTSLPTDKDTIAKAASETNTKMSPEINKSSKKWKLRLRKITPNVESNNAYEITDSLDVPVVEDASVNSATELEEESPKIGKTSKRRRLRLRQFDSPPNAKTNGDVKDLDERKCASPDLILKEVEPDTISLNSNDSGASIKRKTKKQDYRKMEEPDFLNYLELRQDSLMDEHPELTQEEIVIYLYKTWQYEESHKSEQKKNDEIEQSNLIKGVNSNLEPPKKKKSKGKKLINIVKVMSQCVKTSPEDVKPDIKFRELPKRKTVKPFYKEDFSDIEDEIRLFEIFKNENPDVKQEKKETEVKGEPNETLIKISLEKPVKVETSVKFEASKDVDTKQLVEIFDDEYYNEEELYFDQLTKPKPNIFKGLVREKVCEICEKTSNLVKCRGCNGMFHVECVNKIPEVVEIPTPTRGRKKKKKPRGRKPKVSTESTEDSFSDEKFQDANVSEENMSIEEIKEPEVIVIDDVDNFEEQISVKMQELLEKAPVIDYDSFESDDGLDWSKTEAGKCEIVDVKLRPRQQPTNEDYSDFKCKTCQEHDVPICFVCKSTISPKKKIEKRQKCQVAHCHKYFHLECLEHWPQTQFASGEPSRNNKKIDEHFEAITCPRHVCHTCVCDDPRGCKTRFSGDKLARCVRCPATYHSFTKCLPAGSQILTASHIVCPRHYQHRPGKVPYHVNTGWCFICALGGTLICCEYCPTSFHADCLNIEPPEGGYMCEDCETGRLPLYGEMVWVKLGHYRWWPGIILHPSEIPENILAVKHSLGEFVVRFFGQYDHYWVNRGRVFPFQEGDSGRISGQKSKIDEAFTIAMEHAKKAFDILKNVEPNDEENQDIASSLLPPHYVKLKVNKPCGALYGKKIDVEESSLTQCECNPDVEDPCGPYSHCLNRMLLTECGPTCRAGDRCQNRAFEKRLYPKLVPYRTPHRGWGLKTLEDVKAGQFVIEYVGELIDEAEFQRRMRRKHEMRDENYYFLTLDKERMIDAGPKGNLARFMNHCCEPNCETQKWTVLGDVRVGLFAIHDIPANTEVTFNYNLECAGIEKKQCMCGAKRCSGYIGAKPKQDDSLPKKPKRQYKKRKNTIGSPSTSKPNISKPKRPVGRPAKPRELTEIEKDLLIIKNATNGLSSDSEGSGGQIDTDETKDANDLKRKRVSFSEEALYSGSDSPSAKRLKLDEDKSSEVGD